MKILKEIIAAIGIVALTYSPLYDIKNYFTVPNYQKNTILYSANKWETQERWKAKKSGLVQDYRSYINGNIGDYRYWVGFAFCDEEIIKPAYIIKDLKTGLIYIDEDGDGLAERVLKNHRGHLSEYSPFCQIDSD